MSNLEQLLNEVTELRKEVHQLLALTVKIDTERREVIDTVTAAQKSLAASIESLATTLKKAEGSYERMEVRYETLAQQATGKDQIPLRSHYSSLIVAFIPTVVMAVGVVIAVLYVTKYELRASLKNIEISQKAAVEDAVKQSMEDHSEK